MLSTYRSRPPRTLSRARAWAGSARTWRLAAAGRISPAALCWSWPRTTSTSRKEAFQRVMADPSANAAQKAAAALAPHTIPTVAGGADFATEFLEPREHPDRRGRGAAAHRSPTSVIKAAPIIGPAVERASQAMAATFDRLPPLARALAGT